MREKNEEYSDFKNELKFKFTRVVFFQSFLASILLLPFDLYFGEYDLAAMGFAFALQSIISIYLLKFFKIRLLVTNLFLTTCSLVILNSSLKLGVYSEVHVFYIACIALPFMVLPNEAKKSLIYGITLPLFFLVISVLSDSVDTSTFQINDKAANYYILSVNLLSALILAICFFYVYKLNKAAEKRINEQNAILFDAEKMRSLGIMSAGIAHEIRNPLAIILLQAHSILESAKSESEKDDIKKIINSSERINKIIDSLRVYSRQSPEDKTAPVNILNNIERAYSLSRDVLHDVVLKVNIPADIHVSSNETEFLQILLNLFRNSIYATKEMDNPWIKIEAKIANDLVKIYFSDSGSGISVENLNNIFTPFFTTKPVGAGTGLGLSISRKLAESRGGSLYFVPEEENTTFVLELPHYKL